MLGLGELLMVALWSLLVGILAHIMGSWGVLVGLSV